MDIPQPYKEVQPLVIRANLGDTVKVRFQNSLDRRLSIHVQGLSYDVNTSDGASVTEKYGAGDYLYYFGGIDDA